MSDLGRVVICVCKTLMFVHVSLDIWIDRWMDRQAVVCIQCVSYLPLYEVAEDDIRWY